LNNKILTTIIASSLMLASCSGSKSGGAGGAAAGAGAGAGTVTESATATATPGYVGGTAAVGAPLGLATVVIKSTAGTCTSGKTNSLGVYSLDVSACTGPFFIKVSSSLGEVSTLAQSAGEIVNVTPLTQLIAQRAVGSLSLSTVNLAAQTNLKVDMLAKQAEVRTFLNEYAKAIGAVTDLTTVDLMNGSFSADGAGIDKLLDLVKIKDSTSTDVIITVGTNTTITYDVDTSASAPTAISPSTATALAGEVSEKHDILNNVRKITKDFSDAFKNGRPTRAVFEKYVDASFLHQGKDIEYTYEDLEGDDVKGIQFKNVVILNDNPADFWIAFQLMGIENGKYVLWNTWASKVDLVSGKILGNRLPLGLYPAFIKAKWINSSNVVSPSSSTFRVLEIGDAGNVSTMSIRTINGKSFWDPNTSDYTSTISIVGGGVDSNDQIHRFDNRFAEMAVLFPNDGQSPMSKITYRANGASVDSFSYVYVPQYSEENAAEYVDLSYPAFTAVSTAQANCSYPKNSFPEFSDFSLSKQDFELEGFEMYFENYNPGNTFPGFSAYNWEDLTEAKYEAKAADFISKSSGNYLKIGNFAVTAYGENDVEYHSVTICE